MIDRLSQRLFEPNVLQWAREKQGWTTQLAASKLAEHFRHITVDTLEAWEKGQSEPTPAQVRKLAEMYRRPLAVFLLARHPDENPVPPDRRTIRGKRNKALSPEALWIVRRARRIQELAAELDEELNLPRRFKYRRYTIVENPVSLAAKMRGDMGITIADQAAFRRYADFFQYLRAKIEDTVRNP